MPISPVMIIMRTGSIIVEFTNFLKVMLLSDLGVGHGHLACAEAINSPLSSIVSVEVALLKVMHGSGPRASDCPPG